MRRALYQSVREIFVPPPGRVAVLDGVRATAILLVVIFHSFFLSYYVLDGSGAIQAFAERTSGWLTWAWNGDKGVDLFLVLSGFLIARLLWRQLEASKRIDYPRFFGNRLLRITPLYIVVLVAAAAVGFPNRERFWANLLFVNNWLPFEQMFVPWSWAVTIEMQFYLLAPLLVRLVHRAPGRGLAALAALIVAGIIGRVGILAANPDYAAATLLDFLTGQRALGIAMWDDLYVNLYTRAGPLLLGVMAAALVERHGDLLRSLQSRFPRLMNAAILGAAALSILVVTSPLMLATGEKSEFMRRLIALHWVAGRDLFALGAAVMLVAAVLELGPGRLFNRILSARLWFPLAQTSYSIYLLHIFFIGAGYYLLRGGTRGAELALGEVGFVFALALAASFAAGVFTFALIERPFLKLKGRGAAVARAGDEGGRVNSGRITIQALAMLLVSLMVAPNARAGDDARAIVLESIEYWRDSSSDAQVRMTIHRSDWERRLTFCSITKGNKKALVRVLEPKKDAGSATLLMDDQMWSYTPKVNRVIRIPSSMMHQNWMGSDYTNSDIAKSDQIVNDYSHRVIEREQSEKQVVHVIESVPKPDAPVVWGKEILRIRADRLLLGHDYYDQENRLVKRMRALEIRPMGGKSTVVTQRMEDLLHPDAWTEIRLDSIKYGLSVPDSLFQPASLRGAPDRKQAPGVYQPCP
jgi:peptidoglycan/LPS O-acetylase OafA/YrhL